MSKHYTYSVEWRDKENGRHLTRIPFDKRLHEMTENIDEYIKEQIDILRCVVPHPEVDEILSIEITM